MASREHTVEQETARAIHEFSGRILKLFAEHFDGDTTLNYLRIGSFIGEQTLYEPKSTSNAEIAEALGISRPTVTRIVSDLLAHHWITEQPHPEDGRKRLLLVERGHPDADRFERALRKELNELFKRFAAGEICVLDPDRQTLNNN